VTAPEDKAVAERILKIAKESGKESTADLMMVCAEALKGTPYVGGTLDDGWNGEELRLFLTKTDCIIFVETCLGLAQAAKTANPCFNDLARNVSRTRYRCEKAPYSYSDRVHYTTEWLRRQEGTSLRDVTLEVGGKVWNHPINFMSTHSDKYPMLCDKSINPDASEDLEAIRATEAKLNEDPMTYIPKERIASIQGKIKTGDIICFVSSVPGLDIAHVAIASVQDGRVGFVHASMKEKKVVLDSKTIADYVLSRSNLSGIKVIRPL